MKSEPIRHHYIPRFILKNFCFDSNEHVYYFDKIKKEFSVQKIRNVFMSLHLYRDEINTPEQPTKIEKNFAAFEGEVSKIIKEKLLYGNEIVLDINEDAKLRLFFAIMGFRSERVRDVFREKLRKESKESYFHYQKNGDFEDFWKRNLSKLVNCRSMLEVNEHPEIDEPIKMFMQRDTTGIFGLYFVVAERYQCQEYVIGDTYPVVVTGSLINGLPLHIYSVFPISPDRIIMMVGNGAEHSARDVLGFRPGVLTSPKMDDDGTYRIRVKKMYSEEVKMINAMIVKEAQVGYVCKTRLDSYE